jgi:transcriptional regulator GlxA family with amidase domain
MAPIQFGILCIPFQLTDVTGPLDVLSSSSAPYLKDMQQIADFSSEVAEAGIDIEFHYIGETMEPMTSTANAKIMPSTTCATCPKLDYLLVGGPAPSFFHNIPPVFANFMRERAEEVKGFFTTCTGGVVAAMVDLLDGKNATTNHQVVPMAQQLRPGVKWTTEKQWVVDGKFWTAGGACAGMDMFAYWVKENYGQDVAEAGWAALDYEPRDVHGKLVPLKNGLRVNKK